MSESNRKQERMIEALNQSTLTEQDIAYLEKTFKYHPPKGDQPSRYETLRAAARAFATTIITHCPQSRERSLALTKLEEATMWANSSVARNE